MEHVLLTCDLCPAPEACFVVRAEDGDYLFDPGEDAGPAEPAALMSVAYSDSDSSTHLDLCPDHLAGVRAALGLAPSFV